MKTYAFILGRERALSIAELTALNSKNFKLLSLATSYAVAETDQDPTKLIDKLGGIIKIFELSSAEQTEFSAASSELYASLSEKLKDNPGKARWGLNVFGMPVKLLKTILIGAKKELKETGIKAGRFVNHNFENLSSAASLKEGLYKDGNAELALFETKGTFRVGECKAVQNIDFYSERDYGRPGRSMQAGMLPPKLAQIMLNFANLQPGETVYDPFCGSGTVLTEALLVGYSPLGSDISNEQVADTQTNLEWVEKKYKLPESKSSVFQHDVRKPFPTLLVDAVVTEGYLGKILNRALALNEFLDHTRELETLYKSFFSNIKTVLKPNGRLIIALPYFLLKNSKDGFLSDGLYETALKNGLEIASKRLEKLLTGRGSLLYRRSGQYVGREIFIFQRKA